MVQRLDHGSAGCGGVIKDIKDMWLVGYSRKLGNCSAHLAELWGVRDEIKTSSQRGFQNSPIIKDIYLWVDSLEQVRFIYVIGNFNQIENWLVKIGMWQ